jgi:hypothetical protein
MGSNGLPPKRNRAMGSSVPSLVKNRAIPTSPPPPLKNEASSDSKQPKETESDSYSALVSLAMFGMALDVSLGGGE